MTKYIGLKFLSAVALLPWLGGCGPAKAAPNDPVPDDEAKAHHLTAQAFRYAITEQQNFFKGMDAIAGPASTPDQLLQPGQSPVPRKLEDPVRTTNEILGRNTWMLWCAGNEGFWDWLAGHSYGFTDLLKLVDSRTRPTRFKTAGLINEPGMKQAAKPDDNGVWVDVPAEDERHVPAAPEAIYGRSSGVIGLRLFPNPKFEQARAKWDARRYYEDPSYYNDPELVRPYRVGMSCAFCHASFHPLNPPTNVADPRWENLSGSIGAQYLRIRAVFGNLLPKDNFVWHLLDSQPPGTTDTSLIPSDNLNNPNAMNAIFNLRQRVVRSFVNPPETLVGESLTQPAVWGNPKESLPEGVAEAPVWQFDAEKKLTYQGKEADKVPKELWDAFEKAGLLSRLQTSNTESKTDPRYVPRVLFDGADSIGAWGALARVFLNIGCFGEQWNRLHTPLVGFTPQSPFRLKDLTDHSVYWEATQERVAPLRDYFLKVTPPMPLLAAKGAGDKAQSLDSQRTATPVPVGTGAGDKTNETKADGSRVPTNTPDSAGASPPVPIKAEGMEKHRITERDKAKRIDLNKLPLGRKVFADNCIVCHSSIQPENDPTAESGLRGRREELFQRWARAGEFWDHDPGRWLEDDAYRAWAERAVETPGFWKENFLSTDYRVPVTTVGTNPARALGTNGLGGHMWSDFTSQSYKQMPGVGSIKFFNPYPSPGKSSEDTFTPRHKAPKGSPDGGGGPGFYRPPSLISIWATAPFLHNNSLGLFNNDPSVDGRLTAFDDAMRKMLWPAKRTESSSYNEATPERLQRDHGLIWRTTQVTHLTLPGKHAPSILLKLPFLQDLAKSYTPWQQRHFLAQSLARVPWLPSAIFFVAAYVCLTFLGRRKASPDPAAELHRKWVARLLGYAALGIALLVGAFLYLINGKLGDLHIGPIPAGTPVSLLANLNPEADPVELKKAVNTALEAFSTIESKHLTEADAQKLLRERVAPALMGVSKCPDFVMDKGHYLPWFSSMTDEDKDALIELLKTF